MSDCHTLIDNEEKYYGKYVATACFNSRKVIASGESVVDVYNEAKAQGCEDPVVFYIAAKGASMYPLAIPGGRAL